MPIRKSSLRRQSPSLQPRPRILIVCEGRLTEPSYFLGLKQEEQIRLLDVMVNDEGGVPKTLVERAVAEMKRANKVAKKERDNNQRYDEVWCVFDVDEHPNLNEATQQAKDNGIKLAISNPCFELWLLLHFAEQNSWIHRHDAQRACGRFIERFDKHVPFKQVSGMVSVAIERAKRLKDWQDNRGNSQENPYTTVHELVIRLRQMGKSESLRQIQVIRSLS